MRYWLTLLILLITGVPAAAQQAPADPLASFDRLVGHSWRGEATAPDSRDVDVQKWERILGGKAIRVTHSINDGTYGGETIIYAEKGGALVYYYFTTAGYMTHGRVAPAADGSLVSEEEVTGHPEITRVRSTLRFVGDDGSHEVKSEYLKGGSWVPGHGFRYRPADGAEPRWQAAR